MGVFRRKPYPAPREIYEEPPPNTDPWHTIYDAYDDGQDTSPTPPVPPPPPAPPPAPPAYTPPPYTPTDFGGGDQAQQDRQRQDARNAGPPLGFDAAKWRDPTLGTSHKYTGATTLAASGSIPDMLRQPEFAGWKQIADDKIQSPEGSIYDVYYDYGGPNQRVQWTYVGGGPAGKRNDNIPGNLNPPQSPNANSPADSSLGSWDDFLGNLGGGQGVNAQPGMGGNVGQDWFSQLINSGYGSMIGGQGATPFGHDVNATLRDVIADAAQGPDSDRMNARFETLREQSGMAQRAMANDARGALASRNLLSEPGTPQGPEIDAMTRISESLAIPFAQGLRDAYTDESQFADQRLLGALGLASGQSQAQGSTMLGALGGATERQGTLADIALGTLDRNIVWNKFLAEYGLDRERLANEIQMGRFENIQKILELFALYVDMARKGKVSGAQ